MLSYNFRKYISSQRYCLGLKTIKCPISVGSHCLDILVANSSTDPQWLVKQRMVEIKIIKKWIAKYKADLLAFKQLIPI
jgi:hypothetical protein